MRFPILITILGVSASLAAAQNVSEPVPIRSIDPTNDAWDDLAPVAAAIGDARVVVIGECSHGDGAAQAARPRLFRFLRERHGFSVLVLEAGAFDANAVDRAMEEGRDLADTTRLGLPNYWRASGQFTPLLDDVWSSYFEDIPVRVAGIAPEFTSADAATRFGRDLTAFFAAPGVTVDRADLRRFDAAATSLDTASKRADAQAIIDASIDLAEALDAIEDNRDALELAHGELEVDRWRLLIEDRLWAADEAASNGEMNTLADCNPRARRMADRLVWLAEEAFPDRKLVVACATWHALANPDALTCETNPELIAAAINPGATWREALGDDLRVIAITPASGAVGWPGAPPVNLAPLPPDALESATTDETTPFAFIDLRKLADNTPLATMPSRLAGLDIAFPNPDPALLQADWRDQLDAVLVINQTFPATHGAAPDDATLTSEPETAGEDEP